MPKIPIDTHATSKCAPGVLAARRRTGSRVVREGAPDTNQSPIQSGIVLRRFSSKNRSDQRTNEHLLYRDSYKVHSNGNILHIVSSESEPIRPFENRKIEHTII